jgi:hypothetical protein
VKLLTVIYIHHPEARAAKRKSPFQHRVENRPKVPRGRIGDAQDLGGRGMLSRASRVSVTETRFSIAKPPDRQLDGGEGELD